MSAVELSDDGFQEFDYDAESDSAQLLRPFIPIRDSSSRSPQKPRRQQTRQRSTISDYGDSKSSSHFYPSASSGEWMTTTSSEGSQLCRPTRHHHHYSPGPKQQRRSQVELLEEENKRLRQQNLVLQTEVSTIRNLYQDLTQSLLTSNKPTTSSLNSLIPSTPSGLSSTLIPISSTLLDSPLQHGSYPNVRFWFRKDWVNQKKEKLGITKVDLSSTSEENKGRSSLNVNVTLRYMEDQNGEVIDGFRASEMHKFARSIWGQLSAAGKAPRSWGKADLDVATHYRREMRQHFPEFALCEYDWKAEQLATDNYPNWVVNNLQAVKEEPVEKHVNKRRRDSTGTTLKKAKTENLSNNPPIDLDSASSSLSSTPAISSTPEISSTPAINFIPLPTNSSNTAIISPRTPSNVLPAVSTISLPQAPTIPTITLSAIEDQPSSSISDRNTSAFSVIAGPPVASLGLNSNISPEPILMVSESSNAVVTTMQDSSTSHSECVPDSVKSGTDSMSIDLSGTSQSQNASTQKLPQLINPLSLQPLSFTLSDLAGNLGHQPVIDSPSGLLGIGPNAPELTNADAPAGSMAMAIPMASTSGAATSGVAIGSFSPANIDHGHIATIDHKSAAVPSTISSPMNASTCRAPDDSSQGASGTEAKKLAPSRKVGKMRPGASQTARNLCAQDWIQANPLGTTAEFKIYYDDLSVEDKKSLYSEISRPTEKPQASIILDLIFVTTLLSINWSAKGLLGLGAGVVQS